MSILDRFKRYERELQNRAAQSTEQREPQIHIEKRELAERDREALARKKQALDDRQVERGPLERLVDKPELRRADDEVPLRGMIREEIQNPTAPRVQDSRYQTAGDRGDATQMELARNVQADPSPSGAGYTNSRTWRAAVAPTREIAPEPEQRPEPVRPVRLIDEMKQEQIMKAEQERRRVQALTPEQRRAEIIDRKRADRTDEELARQLKPGHLER